MTDGAFTLQGPGFGVIGELVRVCLLLLKVIA